MAETKPATPAPKDTGWLPDYVYVGEKMESGLAFFADVTGRIVRFSREPADLAAAKRLPGQAALPGLVNTHAQSWQRVLRGRLALRSRGGQETVDGWREAQAMVLGRLGSEDIYDAARMAFLEMLVSGITCVGETLTLHRQPDGTPWPEPLQAAEAILRAAHDIGVRVALLNGAAMRENFGQPAGSAPARSGVATADDFIQETERLREHIQKNHPGDEAWIGVAPHSLAAVPLDALKAIATYARAKRLRLHLRMGEFAAEHAACLAEYGRSPAALLADAGLLDKRFIPVFGTHLGDEDLRTLGVAHVTVCACPGSGLAQHAGALQVDKLVAAGGAIALGTEGALHCNLLEDARLLEYQLRGRGQRAATFKDDVAAALFGAATVAGARSLGAPSGALEVGRPADFFTVNVFDPALVGASADGLLGALVLASSARAIREVWVGARQRVGQWRHPAQSAVIGRFAELQKKLWAGGS